VMDVTVGEDRYGIWVAGALRPDVDDLKIRAIKASGVSGDWRPIDNRLELVAICAVNVPGFPIPRALAASADDEEGHRAVYALVAAGVEPLYALAHKDPAVEALEYALVDIETKMDWMRASLAVLASALDPAEDDAEDGDDDDEYEPEGTVIMDPGAPEPDDPVVEPELEPEPEPVVEPETASAEPEPDPEPENSSGEQQLEFAFAFHDDLDGERLAQEIVTASAAHLLWDDGLPIQFSQAQTEMVSLRLKFRRSMDIDTSKRAAALTAGAAMPDGRLPILTEDDLYQALLIVPEDSEHFGHLARRAMALGLDIDEMRGFALVAAAGEKYDAKQRKELAKKGEALPDGSFPIADEEDLRNAISSYGRAGDKAKAKAHIMRRARALRKVDLLPDKWED